jgi:hypothetical protein
MNGPSNNDRETLGNRLKRQTFLVEIFGAVVGGGLVVEYWKEIVDCFVNRHLPSQQLSGGLLVVIGVWGEVMFSRLLSATSEKIQTRADSDASIANAQAALESLPKRL